MTITEKAHLGNLIKIKQKYIDKLIKLLNVDKQVITSQNYKNNLKAAWSENMDIKSKRITVKEIFRWFKGLEENKWRKTYPIDARRISYFVNNHGLNEDEMPEMPKSLQKKNPDASYVREQKYAQKFIEYKEQTNQLEEMVRIEIRDILKEMLNEAAPDQSYSDMAIHDLAQVIQRDWKKVNYAAKPYLDAMYSLGTVQDKYFMDSGKSIVAYFLSNASS